MSDINLQIDGTSTIDLSLLDDGTIDLSFLDDGDISLTLDGISTFHALSDTPTSYSGQSGKVVAVKSSEDGVEFTNSGLGDVVGPIVSVDENISVFDLTTGKLIKDSGVSLSEVIANTAKTGITAQQISDITANNAKISYNDSAAVSLNTTHKDSAHAPTNAEANVNADWNSSTGDSQIINKPTIPSNVSDLTNDSGFISDISSKADITYVDSEVAGIVSAAPATLDTLNELAAALGDDPSFATTVSTQIGLKANTTDIYTQAQIDTSLSGKSDTHTHPYSSTSHNHIGVYEPLKGVDDNFVTDAEKIVVANTSGTNTGDQVIPNVSDTAYNATSWNTNTDAPSKNSIRDKVDSMDTAIGLNTSHKDSEHAPSNANNYVHPASHAISEITNLQTSLDGKAAAHTHPYLADSTTTISVGQTSAIVTNTAKTGITAQQSTDITTNNSKVSYTDSAAVSTNTTHSSSSHAPSNAEANDANTTLQGNVFNGISQLVQLDVSGKLPTIDGSNLTNVSGGSGELNVNADWDAVSGDELILNKPTTISSQQATDITTNNSKISYTDAAVVSGHTTSISGLVPYTGATSNVDLGTNGILANGHSGFGNTATIATNSPFTVSEEFPIQGIAANYVADWNGTVNNTGYLRGIQTNVRLNGGTGFSNGIVEGGNFLVSPKWAGGGDVTEMNGLNVKLNSATAYTDTITDFRFLRLQHPGNAINITNMYGILLDDINLGSNLNYAIKTGAGLVDFGDSLNVNGTITSSGRGLFYRTDTDGAFTIGRSDTTPTVDDDLGSFEFSLDSGSGFGSLSQIVGSYKGVDQGAIRFRTKNTTWGDRMMILPNGNVGIGTNNPNRILHISGSSNPGLISSHTAGRSFGILAGTGFVVLDFDADGDFAIRSNSKEAIDSGSTSGSKEIIKYKSSGNVEIMNGNVGIGTNSPSEKLDITGNIAVSGTVDGIDIATDVAANTAKISYTDASDVSLNTTYRGVGHVPLSGGTMTGDLGLPNGFAIKKESSIYTHLCGDGVIDGGLAITIPNMVGADFYIGYNGNERFYIGKNGNTHFDALGNLYLEGNLTLDGTVDGVNVADSMGTIVHGAIAGTARPTGFDVVTWIGSVPPDNSQDNDIWIDTT